MNTIFIDESGDLGISMSKGSSEVFVIAICVFKSEGDLIYASQIINKFKVSIGKSSKYEMKFRKLNKEERFRFYNLIKPVKVIIRYVVWRKRNLKLDYDFIISSLIDKSSDIFSNSVIYFDSFGDRMFRQSFVSQIRKLSKVKGLKFRIKFVNSKNNSLIQFADLIVGGIHKSFQPNRNDRQEYIKIFKDKLDMTISI
jgi:hypothetical protein